MRRAQFEFPSIQAALGSAAQLSAWSEIVQVSLCIACNCKHGPLTAMTSPPLLLTVL